MHKMTLRKAMQRIAELEKQLLDTEVKYKKLLEEAKLDDLTGLHGKKFLQQKLHNLININKRRRKSGPKPIVVVFFDIDHFKQLNDTHGHVAGDKVLTDVVKVLKSSVRPGDTLVRYGGEEFVAILSNDDEPSCMSAEQSAHAFVDRIRGEISIRCKSPNGKGVTVSAGVFVDTKGESTLEELIEFADKNMYVAKRSGRNCVISSVS